MTQDELLRLVTSHLDRGDPAQPWSKQHGAVLYSGLASIRPGPFYLMGINPGGQPHEGAPIQHSLYATPNDTNSYADQCWTCSSLPCGHIDPTTGRLRPEARTSMQKRVCDLIDVLGVEPKDILSTNLVFRRWGQLKNLPDKGEWQRRCWGVHEHLLSVVKPRWIISLGYGSDDAYTFLLPRGSGLQKQVAEAAWHYRREMDFGDGPQCVDVLGVPHPGKQGFIKLGGGECYPDDLKDFIAKHVRPGAAEGGQ